MKLLTIANRYPPDIVGGAEIVAAALCEGLALQGHEVHVLTSRTERGCPEEHVRHGVNVRRVWPGSSIFPPEGLSRARSLLKQVPVHLLDLRNGRVVAEMARLCASLQPDVVHTHNLYGLSPAIWGGLKKQGLPVVHTAHDCYLLSPTGNLSYNWEQGRTAVRIFGATYRRWYLPQTRSVDVFCVPSEHHLELHQRLGCRASAYRHVPNGVGECRMPNAERPTHSGPLRILYLGRLESHKGVPVLLEAAELLAGAAVRFSLAGAGPLEAQVRDAAEALPFLSFEGFVSAEKRDRLFEQSDLLVLPSTCLESFGTVVLEALRRGVPVVTVSTGGQAELVQPGRNGFLVEPDNAVALADLLRELASCPEKVRGMSKAARESVQDLTLARMVEDYLKVYRSLSAG